jgi:protein TonB
MPEHAGWACARAEPARTRRQLWPVFIGLSAAVHAAAILALITESEQATVGQSGNLDAISIQVTIATSAGMPEITAMEEPREASKEDKASIQEKQQPSFSEEAPPLPAEEGALPEKREEAKTASAGQTMAQIEAQQAASGTSAGEIEKYGREVSLALAKSVPKGKGLKGKVTLAFLLGADGKIARLEVVSPSGNASLDDAAQNALRKAVFPLPPQGMTEKQRTYVIPFRFR